ncbi:MAG: hypothetical protein EZS28_048974 [Streblomastix strix]|uniref:Uncharacterized protein n=1 Tax=Streblomastix strix TaxID=222440 RepID=A0A5J4TBI1_9EUKA|nr:MAG: hypothetical protein EZS28_048974 [Streblomastix strix]
MQSWAANTIANAKMIKDERLQSIFRPYWEQQTRETLPDIREQSIEHFSLLWGTKRTHVDANSAATKAISFKLQFKQQKRQLAKFESTDDEQTIKSKSVVDNNISLYHGNKLRLVRQLRMGSRHNGLVNNIFFVLEHNENFILEMVLGKGTGNGRFDTKGT